MSETDTSKDESASSSAIVTSPPSILSPSRPGTSGSRVSGIRHRETIEEVPELEARDAVEESGGSSLFSPESAGSGSSPARVPPDPPVTRRAPGRKSRAMSSAQLNLQHFLDSTASAARRSSLAIKPLLELKQDVNPKTPQFLTVSSSFTTRSRSPSPLPLVRQEAGGPPVMQSTINPDLLTSPPDTGITSPQLKSPSGARYSLDVKSLPSYLARKRTSITFGAKIISNLVEVATSPFEPSSPQNQPLNEPYYEEPEAPVLSLGERIAWLKRGEVPEFGIVRWIGRMPQISPNWTVGIEFDNAIGSGDGRFGGRQYFTAKENFAKFLPLSSLTKVDNYAGRPRSGTLLSRMSVQLKPGQLISVQRTPSINHLVHCALNAPHHVDHDVHAPNMKHCLCHNCNHPCAHLCKTHQTKKDKKKGRDVAHMCHFSHKPHGKLCCGGEELIYEDVIKSPRQSMATTSKEMRRLSRDSGGRKSSSQSSDRRRKSSNHHHQSALERRPSSVPPTSPSKEQVLEHQHHHESSGMKRRTGSDLSVSSLPSTTSPVEVFIARGALTDESGGDTDYEARSPEILHLGSKDRLRSLVSCLVPGMKGRKKTSHRPHTTKHYYQRYDQDQDDDCGARGGSREEKKNHFRPPPPSECSSGSRSRSRNYKQRGLSTTPEVDHSVSSIPSSSGRLVRGSNSSIKESSGNNNINNNKTWENNAINICGNNSKSPNGDVAISVAPRSTGEVHVDQELDPDSSKAGKNVQERKDHLSVHHFGHDDPRLPVQMVTPPSPQILDHCKSSFSSSFLPFPEDQSCNDNKIVSEETEKSNVDPSSSQLVLHDEKCKIKSSASKYLSDPWTSKSPAITTPRISSTSSAGKPPAPKPPVIHGRILESRPGRVSPSDHSNCSSLISPDTRRQKKGRAPRPPRSTCSSTASVASISLGSPACSATHCSTNSRKKRSLKKRPAPTPPLSKALLTRSMSEQRQLNVKNLLNADPSFRSAVDINNRKCAKMGRRERRETEASDDPETFEINYAEEGFKDDDEADDSERCFSNQSDVFHEVFAADHQVTKNHVAYLTQPACQLISFSPRPTSSFRDASVQVSSLKVADPMAADEVAQAYDEDERASERGISANEDDDNDDEEDEDDTSSEGVSKPATHHHPNELVCEACGCHLFKGSIERHENDNSNKWLSSTNNNLVRFPGSKIGLAKVHDFPGGQILSYEQEEGEEILRVTSSDLTKVRHGETFNENFGCETGITTPRKETETAFMSSSNYSSSSRGYLEPNLNILPGSFTDSNGINNQCGLPESDFQGGERRRSISLQQLSCNLNEIPFKCRLLLLKTTQDEKNTHSDTSCPCQQKKRNCNLNSQIGSAIEPTTLLYSQDADFSAISLDLKALLSPQRDWVKCTICQSEVCWLARVKRFQLHR